MKNVDMQKNIKYMYLKSTLLKTGNFKFIFILLFCFMVIQYLFKDKSLKANLGWETNCFTFKTD